MPNYIIRPITVSDAPIVIHHRHQMFKDMGSGTSETRTQMDTHFADWLQQRFEQDRYIGWFAQIDETVIAGAGISLVDVGSLPDTQFHYVPYLVNVYTEPEYRKQGIARKLLLIAIDYCRQQKYPQLKLHASVMGRGLYEKLGFEDSNEMRLKL